MSETESLTQQIERRLSEHEQTEKNLREELLCAQVSNKNLTTHAEALEKELAESQELYRRALSALITETGLDIPPGGLEDAIHRSYQQRLGLFKETTERLSSALDEARANLDRVAGVLGLVAFVPAEIEGYVRSLLESRDQERKENRERAEKIVSHTLACSSDTEFVPFHIVQGQLALVLQLARKIVVSLSETPALPAAPLAESASGLHEVR